MTSLRNHLIDCNNRAIGR